MRGGLYKLKKGTAGGKAGSQTPAEKRRGKRGSSGDCSEAKIEPENREGIRMDLKMRAAARLLQLVHSFSPPTPIRQQ